MAHESAQSEQIMIERKQYTLDDEGKLVFKEGVETIERVMEEDMEQIREVIIPKGAKTIAESEKLPSDFIEKLPASVTKIARDAFEDTPLHDQCIAKISELNDARLRLAYDLDETGTIITFKEGTDTIEGVARADKEKVAEVIIPEGVKVLAKKAFEGCKLLAAVTLPQTLEGIGDEAFKE
ncbi:hypothetical protein TeGR_g11772 [Tetraparma gracilis]|uniref:Uncharacterized protein n=1 Tax=Tetraparma gracilis TaxID=2962635 RepID=A0ABQ6M5J1_9STRA|nr:hypothetical protein TeGR_g11772 [Tetraparma gracilis]